MAFPAAWTHVDTFASSPSPRPALSQPRPEPLSHSQLYPRGGSLHVLPIPVMCSTSLPASTSLGKAEWISKAGGRPVSKT